jgi:hypothetical protein
MSDINITIPGGTSKRLLTKGKRCEDDIVVTAEGGGSVPTPEDLDTELTEQENLLDELKAALEGKSAGQPMEMVATFADGTTKTYIIYGEVAE